MASKRRLRRIKEAGKNPDYVKRCATKRAYKTREEAVMAVRGTVAKWDEEGFMIYKCRYGDHWHHGHAAPSLETLGRKNGLR